ncbi:SPOSA6832_01949 [Sporobolomyces salmonicolor]|uniref:separase n=1 Tax=Sporidiobolus salmonicolor TaxID=5005 RepID=A0A0D6EKT1_SPOSA|nr:SPOSA6832_01949 [Sporobolomyces salmonicolor]
MRIVNSSLATLSSLSKAGFRACSSASTPSPPSSTPSSRSTSAVRPAASSTSLRGNAAHGANKDQAEQAAKEAGRALQDLRKLAKDSAALGGKRVEVEKAAGSLVASLVEMELYRLALIQLSAMRSAILSWYIPFTPPAPPTSSSLLSHVPSFALPLPPFSYFTPPTLSEALSPSALPRPTAVELVTLVIALQQYLVGCLFRAPELSSSEEGQRRRAEALEEILRLDGGGEGGGPLDWRALLDREGAWDGMEQSAKEALMKRTDAMMTSMFGTVTKGCTGTDGIVAPEILLTLRAHALLYYSTTSALAPSSDKLPAFHDQLRKLFLLYGRSAEAAPYSYSPTKVCSAVKEVFATVVERLEGKSVRCEGERWGEVCDVVLHIAKRADDLALIERVSSLLGSPSPSASPSPSPSALVNPCSQLAQLCAKTINALSVFELWLKSHQSPDKAGGVADQLRRVLGCLTVLTRLRCLPSSEVPTEAKFKLDKTLDALRHVLARHLRSGGVDGPPKRPDQLLTPSGSFKPVEPDPSKREIGDLARECLDKLAGHVEHIALEGQGGEVEEKERERLDNLTASAVDTLVLLAYDRLMIDDRTTYTPCFALLSRALPLVRRHGVLALSLHYSIRTLASTLYNIGGTLFNVQKPEAAVRFVQRACDLGNEALVRAREEEGEGKGADGLMEQMERLKLDHAVKEDQKRDKDTEERKEAVRDLERLMARRWELLAVAQHAIGEKKAAYDAYVSAVLAQPVSILDSLSQDASKTPLSKLLDMHAPLYKLIQRLTRIATFDLLLPPSQISLSYSLSPPSGPTPSPAVRGVLLELQLAALDLTSEKLESQRAASAVLDALEDVYRAQDFPMRRARVLIRRMQQQCTGGEVARDLKAAATAVEIDALAVLTHRDKQDLGQDAALRSFQVQYLALSHLHLAFHAHYAQLSLSSESVSTEAHQALSILRKPLDGVLPPSPSAPAPQARTVVFQPSPTRQTTTALAAVAAAPAARRRMTRAAATPAAKGRTALKTPQTIRTLAGRPGGRRGMPAVAEQVTPPPKSAVELKEPVKTPPRAERSAAGLLLDDPERCYVLLGASFSRLVALRRELIKLRASAETMAHLLGVLGFSVLRISYLKFLRRLSSKLNDGSNAAFVTSSAHLAHEYLRLGKTARAGLVFAQADQRLQSAAKAGSAVPPAVEVTHSLYYAEYLALLGNHDRSAQAYETAMTLAEGLGQDDASASTTARIVERTLLLQRAANAARVCSVMLQRKGDLARSLAPATQSMRVYQRALNNVSRLTPSLRASSPDSDPSDTFIAPRIDHVTPLNDLVPASRKRNRFGPGVPQAGVSWQLAEQLACSILRVASLHHTRGTPKSAEFYALQAREFAQELGSARLVARAAALRAEVRIHAGKLEEAAEDLAIVEGIIGTVRCSPRRSRKSVKADSFRPMAQHSCPEAVEAQRLRADLHLRNSLRREAYQLYLQAQASLESFVRSAADAETTQTSIKRSSSAKHLSPVQHRSATKAVSPLAALSPSPSGGRAGVPSDWILPAAHAYLLRMRSASIRPPRLCATRLTLVLLIVVLLRLQNKTQESQALLKRLSKLAMLEEDKADELKLLVSIQLQDMLTRCSSDPVLGMLPDSVLSMPAMGSSVSAVVKIGTPRTGPTLLDSLKKIELLLTRAIAFSASRAQPDKLRELSLLSATMHTLHASVGKPSKRAAASVAHVLDLGIAVTLRREMLDAIDHKLADSARRDDLSWPSVEPPSLKDDDVAHLQLLQTMRERYRLETPEPILTDASMSSLLPPSWSTISLHLSSERDCLVLVRHRRDAEPIVFKLPLDRLARREGEEEEEAFTYDVAASELKEIIELSNAGTQNAKHVDGKEARAAWWQERKELDRRLQKLLQTVEGAWLGAFKASHLRLDLTSSSLADVPPCAQSVFYDARGHAPDAFATFKARVEHILKRSIVRAAQDKKSTRFKLDDAVIECLAALPASSREEDIEDLFYFMMESFQFSGVPLACDETDVDQVVVDLREALEELHGTKSAPKGTPDPDEHTFLVLDKTLQAFPWESLPCLRGRSVSRLPSLSFLRDRLDLAASRSTSEDRPFEIVLNPKSAAFVLNPGGDLGNTQKTFEPWLEQQAREVNWNGIVGRAPGEDEVKAALASKELFLYFGHGGAEQYTIRHLPRCAVTMLWGCSSGLLKDQGDFDPVGTPYHYMVAGSWVDLRPSRFSRVPSRAVLKSFRVPRPALVANLWDVTDKDIDKFAQSVFDKTGLSSSSASTSTSHSPASLTSAVATSREVCNLRYLNGAAPVVYGVPVRFAAPL